MRYIYEGVCAIMVIVVENGYDEPSSKCVNSTFLPPAMGKY